MTTATPVADAIRAMQDRLGGQRMWCRGVFHRGDAACLMGAIGDLAGAKMIAPATMYAFLYESAAAWTGQSHFGSLAYFNDSLADKHELLLFLDAALDVAEAEGL